MKSWQKVSRGKVDNMPAPDVNPSHFPLSHKAKAVSHGKMSKGVVATRPRYSMFLETTAEREKGASEYLQRLSL